MKYSKRARLFAEVLEYINNDDWGYTGDFLVFGKEAFERYTRESIEEATGIEDLLRESVSNAKVKRGKRSVHKRISLEPLPRESADEDLKALLSRLPEQLLRGLAEEFSTKNTQSDPVASPRKNESDDRDAALALESIQWLDQAAARLGGLDEVDAGIGLARNEQYFEEAHRCDLAGLKIATAVLCRAVLEAALVQVIDPDRKIQSTLKPKESYIKLMLMAAGERRLLDEERVKVGIEIRDAGSYAIHDLLEFRKRFSRRMHHIVDNTRKVLADLHAS